MKWSSLLITTVLSLFFIPGLWTVAQAQRGTVRFASRSQKIDPEPESFDLPVNPEGAPQTVQNDRFVRRRTTTSIPLEKQDTSSVSSRRELARAGQSRPIATRRSFATTEEDGDPRKVRRLDQRAKQQIPSRSESPTRDTFARRVDTDVVDYLPPVTNEVVTTNTENVAINRRRPKQRQFREESTTTASSRPTVSRGRLERKSSRLTTETPKLSKAALEDVSGSSERPVGAIISRGTAKAVRKPSSDERDDGSSEENYPEPFKKLLKAKLIDNKLKSSYVKKLEDTPEKNKGGATRTYSTTEQPTKISRTLVRKPTSTEITVQISRRIIQEAAQQEDKTRENVSARNSRERSAPTKSSEQTYRSSRFSIEKSTSTEAFVETFRTSKESNESAQSGERLTSARQIRTRSRFTERSQQSSEEKIKNTVQSSKEVTSSGGLESAKYSKENDTNVNSAERLQSVAQEGRKNTDIRFRVKVLSTTTPGPTTTVKLITPRPVRTYTRRQNTLSYLTSTTTEPTTTTRKPFSPAPRNSSVVQRKPPSPVADTNVGKVTKVTAEPAQKPQRPTLSPRSSAGTRQPTTIARKAPASYTRQTTPPKPKADPEDGPRKISLLYTDPLQYLRRSTPSPVSPTKATVAEDNENLVEAPAKKPFRGAQPRKSLPSRVGNGEAKTTTRPPQTSKPFANAALKRPPSFSSAGRGNKKAAVYTPTIPTFTTQSTVMVSPDGHTIQKPANSSTKLPSRLASLSSLSSTAALANEIGLDDGDERAVATPVVDEGGDPEESEDYSENELEPDELQRAVSTSLQEANVVAIGHTSATKEGGSETQIDPISSGLTQSRIDVDTPGHRAKAVTVSIFSALSEILSQPTGTTTIIEILRKYNEENQLDAKVKSDNVFSLASAKVKQPIRTTGVVSTTTTATPVEDGMIDKSREDVRVVRPNAPDLVYRWRPPATASSTESVENGVELSSTSEPKYTTAAATPSVSENTVPDMTGVGKGGRVDVDSSEVRYGESTQESSDSAENTVNDGLVLKGSIGNILQGTRRIVPLPELPFSSTTQTVGEVSSVTTTATAKEPATDLTILKNSTPVETTSSTTTTTPRTTTTTSTTTLRTTRTTTTTPRTTTTTPRTTTTTPRTTTTPYTTSTTTTTPKPTTTTTTVRPTTTTTTTSRPTTTRSYSTTTQRTRTTTYSDSEDLAFLRQLARFLNGGQLPNNNARKTTRKPTTTTSTSTTPRPTTTIPTTTTTSTTTTTTTSTTTTTTPRPTTTPSLSTVIVDKDDPAFLNDVRKLPNFATPNPLVDTPLANRILQLAIQRDPKSIARLPLATGNESPSFDKTPTESQVKEIPKPTATTLSPEEIEKTKKQLDRELQQYNSDLKLLSNLLGRPISAKELPNLTKQLGGGVGGGGSSVFLGNVPATARVTTTTTTTTTTRRPSATADGELLKQLLLTQQQQHNSSPAVIERPEFYGKTNEAILAAVLKQRGIGPTNTNGNIEDILAQISPGARTSTLPPIVITTPRPTPRRVRPPQPPPLRSQSPILDGLSWLWREWQATAPQPRNRVPSGGASPASLNAGTFGLSGGGGLGGGGRTASLTQSYRDEGLDPDAKPINPSVTEEPPSLFGGFGINPGGQLLNAAIGVTRAVSQFLGVALQGAAKSFTSAFRPPPAASEPTDDLSYLRYSGR